MQIGVVGVTVNVLLPEEHPRQVVEGKDRERRRLLIFDFWIKFQDARGKEVIIKSKRVVEINRKKATMNLEINLRRADSDLI